MSNALRMTPEQYDELLERRKKTAGAGARERATPERRTIAPAPAALVIGIDPGVETGLAFWNTSTFVFERLLCLSILQAMREVDRAVDDCKARSLFLFVMFEDARKRGVFDKADEREKRAGAAVREGAGSVKRDCSIWEEFLIEREIPYKAKAPMTTKWDHEKFTRLTKWRERTNEHKRDAGMIVYGLNAPMIQSALTAYLQKRESGR